MVDKSLLHFVVFICLMMGYWLYEQSNHIDKLHNTMNKAAETIIRQNDAIEAQALYIKLLEMRLQGEYSPYSDPNNQI
ncbi:hypothetical protein CMI37_15180 [Candidatus Pacearchaeota archaeon]|nr:hypothetical protein [Candidatus Pacearchaeota archaeon]|tara:strand:- start:111 stop:344 length:234 start_codon:yes stop_codon:yes gene_type:complete